MSLSLLTMLLIIMLTIAYYYAYYYAYMRIMRNLLLCHLADKLIVSQCTVPLLMC